MDILMYLQGKGSHSIDVLLAIFYITQAKQKSTKNEDVNVRWKDVKDYMSSEGKRISDSTYRARRDELLEMGLIELQKLDVEWRADVKITEKGKIIAFTVKEFVGKLTDLEERLKSVESEK